MMVVQRYVQETITDLYEIEVDEGFVAEINSYILSRLSDEGRINFKPLTASDVEKICRSEKFERTDETLSVSRESRGGTMSYKVDLGETVRQFINESLWGVVPETIDSETVDWYDRVYEESTDESKDIGCISEE